jgi:rRNA maturation protein Nop10
VTMQLQVTQKGALYTAECARCGATLYSHEWATFDHNDRRDAMQDGTLRCDECGNGTADPETFSAMPGRYYAARYSMPGYLDCTEWSYGTNRRALVRDVRDMYGD